MDVDRQWLSELAPHFYKFKGGPGTERLLGVEGVDVPEHEAGAARKQPRLA